MTYDAQWYHSPIDLPERTSGSISIRHRIIPKGKEVTIVSMRQALLRGIRPVMGKTEVPLRIHELVEEKENYKALWMTDLPEELNQIGEMVESVDPQGKVLVGGLGLGILAATVAQRPGVDKVVVVERSEDVIKLTSNPGLYTTVNSDIRKFLETTRQKFDYYLLDTWTGTNEGTWWHEVMPLRRIIRQRWGFKPTIHGWAEDIMWGQIYRSLTHHTVPHWFYSYLPVPMSGDEANVFLNTVGLPSWEKKYGAAVDRYTNEMEKRLKYVEKLLKQVFPHKRYS